MLLRCRSIGGVEPVEGVVAALWERKPLSGILLCCRCVVVCVYMVYGLYIGGSPQMWCGRAFLSSISVSFFSFFFFFPNPGGKKGGTNQGPQRLTLPHLTPLSGAPTLFTLFWKGKKEVKGKMNTVQKREVCRGEESRPHRLVAIICTIVHLYICTEYDEGVTLTTSRRRG